MGLSKIKDLKLCYELAESIGISLHGLKRHNTYIDTGFFFDHVLQLADSYVTFCQVTDSNRGRYLLLLELNKALGNSNYFISSNARIFEHNDVEWFYEQVPIFSKQYTSLTVDELLTVWNNIDQLNKEANSVVIEQSIVEQNNRFFKEIVYYKEIEMLLPDQFANHNSKLNSLYMNFADVEKVFELNRIDTDFKMAGLQSFVPCPSNYAKAVSVIWSSLDDTDQILKDKLKLVDHSIIKIINRSRENLNPEYYRINIDTLLKHYTRIERLWNEELQ